MNEARLRLGHIFLLAGDLDGATTHFTQVQSSDSTQREDFLANLFLGQISERRGDLADAIARYRAATERAPHWQSAQIALSHALFRSGERKEALAQLQKSFRLPLACSTSPGGHIVSAFPSSWTDQFRSCGTVVVYRSALALPRSNPRAL